MTKSTVSRETLPRAAAEALATGARAFRAARGVAPNVAVVPAATAKALGMTQEAAQAAAAKILGSLGGRAGRGASKRRPVDYRALGKLSAGWRRVPGRFYYVPVSGEAENIRFVRNLLVCGGDGVIYELAPWGGDPNRGYAVCALQTLPRGSKICPKETVPPLAKKAARRLIRRKGGRP